MVLKKYFDNLLGSVKTAELPLLKIFLLAVESINVHKMYSISQSPQNSTFWKADVVYR